MPHPAGNFANLAALELLGVGLIARLTRKPATTQELRFDERDGGFRPRIAM